MEDAMILNKSAHERGFGYGTVYKSDIFDLKDERGTANQFHFGYAQDLKTKEHSSKELVGDDGLPRVGAKIHQGDPICAYADTISGKTKFHKYKGDETCFIDEVRVLGSDLGDAPLSKVQIKLRIPRSPVIGDKF